MNYETNFTAITMDGRRIPSKTIGIGYANLYYAEGEINSGDIVPVIPADEVVLHFTRVEDLIYDLYRHTDRKSFKLTQWIIESTDDGEIQKKEKKESLVTIKDLQEFLIASYPDITLPAVFVLFLATGKWRYQFSLRFSTKFEIS